MNRIYRSHLVCRLLATSLASLMLGVCACPVVAAKPLLSEEYEPFAVVFSKKDGKAVVLDAYLKPLTAKEYKLPRVLPPTKGQSGTVLRQTYNFNAMGFTGSHYIIIPVGPYFAICVDLWHWDGTPPGNTCAELGFPR